MNTFIRWTNLSWTRISELLKGKGLNVGRYVVKNLKKQLGYVRRKMFKCKTMAQVAFRNDQLVIEPVEILNISKNSQGNLWLIFRQAQ
jgi:hypothetical protein